MQTSKRLHFTRAKIVLSLKHRLEKDSFPRFQMGFIVALTGASGLLFSFILMRAGIDSMAIRYPIALIAAYAFFLFLLWLWLRTNIDEYFNGTPNMSDFMPSSNSGDSTPDLSSGGDFIGGGGDFGGGGASGSFDQLSASIDAPASNSESLVGDATAGFDVGELAIPIFAIVLAVGIAFASLYIVYLAPTLFAELLFDGALSYTLYRRLKVPSSEYWLSTAFRRTIVPFGLTAVFLVAIGIAMAAYAPGAHSIGEVIQLASR